LAQGGVPTTNSITAAVLTCDFFDWRILTKTASAYHVLLRALRQTPATTDTAL
jgi:hypothetical protein